MAKARILVVDDSEVIMTAVCQLLETQPDFEVVCKAATGFEAIRRAREVKPDVILLDVSLPGMRGTEAAREIRAAVPASRILFLSLHDAPSVVREALDSGGFGYVVKTDAGKELVAAVRAVLKGGSYLSAGCRLPGTGTSAVVPVRLSQQEAR